MATYHTVRFGAPGPGAPAPADDLRRLHASLLPTSPIALLGPRFMERFYYRLLPRDGLICGALAYVDGEPAGFIVATQDSAGFMRAGLRRHGLSLLWVVSTSLLASPTRLPAVLEAWRLMRSQPAPPGTGTAGEILSLGVVPEYRGSRFIRESGIQVAIDLLERAVERLRAQGVRQIRAVVDQDNTAAKLFYHGLGWTLSRDSVAGWRTPSVEFLWAEEKAGLPSGGGVAPVDARADGRPGVQE